MSDEPTDETDGERTEPDESTDGEATVSASLGASAVLELDTVDVERGIVRTRQITADDDAVGAELGIDVGPITVEGVLNPTETARLVTELAALSKEMTVEADDESSSSK